MVVCTWLCTHWLRLPDYGARRHVAGQRPGSGAWAGGEPPALPTSGVPASGGRRAPPPCGPWGGAWRRQLAAPRQAPGAGAVRPARLLCGSRAACRGGRRHPGGSGAPAPHPPPALGHPRRWPLRPRAPRGRIPSPRDAPAGGPAPWPHSPAACPLTPPLAPFLTPGNEPSGRHAAPRRAGPGRAEAPSANYRPQQAAGPPFPWERPGPAAGRPPQRRAAGGGPGATQRGVGGLGANGP